MRKRLLFILGLIYCSYGMSASVQYLTVEKKSGEKFSFPMSEEPLITFSGGDIVFNGDASTTYSISEVNRYYYTEGDHTNTENTVSDLQTIVCVADNEVLVKNATANSKLVLMNAGGVVLNMAITDDAGNASVLLPSPKGVYVLSVGKQSVKLIRK